MPAATRITICPIEATNNYGELTRFEVDTATTSLREVADRINADPMLRDGTQLLTYEGGVAGDPIDMLNPSVAMGPLAAIVPLLLPRASANGLTEFAEGQELWLVVDGYATDSDVDTIADEDSDDEDDGSTPLHAAAFRGDTKAIRRLVEELGADVATTDENGQSPLHVAAGNGHTDTVLGEGARRGRGCG